MESNRTSLLVLVALLVLTHSAFAEDRVPATAPATQAGPIAAALQPYVDRGVLAGAVALVADKERVLSCDAVGFADVEARKPMPADAVFWIASQTKAITGAAVMILVDEGKVSLDDPIEKFLPEFRGLWVAVERDKEHVLLKRPARSVTVRDCMNHTSGMPFKSALEDPSLDQLPLKDAVRSYAMTPLASQPGEKYQYSNCGINTAGRIIEVVSGMPYEQFMHRRLFEPLGMKDTTFFPSAAQLARLAKTYKPNLLNARLVETRTPFLSYPLDGPGRYAMPGGGLFSTADDVGRFCRMVLNDGTFEGKRVLSVEAVRAMTSRQTPEGMKESYGIGWAANGDTFGHGGALSTDMTVDRGRGLVYVWLVQHAGYPGDGGKASGAFRKAALERFDAVKQHAAPAQ